VVEFVKIDPGSRFALFQVSSQCQKVTAKAVPVVDLFDEAGKIRDLEVHLFNYNLM